MKRKIEKKFHKTINSIDIFASRVHLNFKKRPYQTTTTGGLLSIVVTTIFMMYFWSKWNLVDTPRGNTY